MSQFSTGLNDMDVIWVHDVSKEDAEKLRAIAIELESDSGTLYLQIGPTEIYFFPREKNNAPH